jgi:uncharacterized membrane protein (DUF106 family)
MSKQFLIGLIYISLIIILIFYWYEVRPMAIRANCELVARTAVRDKTVPTDSGNHVAYEEAYIGCLRGEGIDN